MLTKRSPSVALQFPSLSASITFVHVCERFLQLKSSSKLEPVVLHSWANSVLPFSPRFACLPQQYNYPVLRSRAPSAQVREETIPPIRETAVVAVAYEKEYRTSPRHITIRNRSCHCCPEDRNKLSQERCASVRYGAFRTAVLPRPSGPLEDRQHELIRKRQSPYLRSIQQKISFCH